MRAVHAYIREHLAEHVIAELQAAGCERISVLEVRGISRHVAFEATEPSVSLAQRVECVVKLENIGSDAETSSWADVIAQLPGRGARVMGSFASFRLCEQYRFTRLSH